MHLVTKFDHYIFDCDGVILDSNSLKISAMREALTCLNLYSKNDIELCLDHFKNNFGTSRQRHINYFLSHFLPASENAFEEILNNYSASCLDLYKQAKITSGFEQFIKQLDGKKYVASGSDEYELRKVFQMRGLSSYFEFIYGSPESKISNVEKILLNTNRNAVMIGDSYSDYDASIQSNIKFIFYSPLSNTKKEMLELSKEKGFPIIHDWKKLDHLLSI